MSERFKMRSKPTEPKQTKSKPRRLRLDEGDSLQDVLSLIGNTDPSEVVIYTDYDGMDAHSEFRWTEDESAADFTARMLMYNHRLSEYCVWKQINKDAIEKELAFRAAKKAEMKKAATENRKQKIREQILSLKKEQKKLQLEEDNL